jgi:hypothetical protein
VGSKPTEFYETFEEIAKELVGKEGKRKVRTVVFRSFLYSLQKGTSVVQNNTFLELAKNMPLSYMEPLFLWKILIDYETARFMAQKIALCVDNMGHLSTPLLSKRLVQQYGDRDVVKKSFRAFKATLVNFGILKHDNKSDYLLLPQQSVSASQVRDFLKLYAASYLKSEFVDLQSIPTEFFQFFRPVDLVSIAREYNGICWEYVRETERNVVIMKG